jgi:hypothetical protein
MVSLLSLANRLSTSKYLVTWLFADLGILILPTVAGDVRELHFLFNVAEICYRRQNVPCVLLFIFHVR